MLLWMRSAALFAIGLLKWKLERPTPDRDSLQRLDLFDLRRLTHVLKDEFDITPALSVTSKEVVVRFTERELKLAVYTRQAEPPSLEETTEKEEP